VSDANKEAADMLRELAELVTLEEGDVQSFRVRAYENAQRAVDAYAGDLSKLTAAQLQKVEGIGASTAKTIREMFDKGSVEKLVKLREAFPKAFVDLLRVPGIGPKGALKLRKEVGVDSIEALRQAIAEQKLRKLKGFGEKSEVKLAAILERMDREGHAGRTPISVAWPLAQRLEARFRALPGVSFAMACGSTRRFAETVGDLDVVVASTAPAAVMDDVVGMPMVERVIGRGDTKASVVTRRGLQIDVRVVAPEQIGAATLYFTGSKAHNVALRQRALARGWTLNEYGLTELESKKVVASESEHAIYEALGLPFIPPELREGAGEIEAAERGELPALCAAVHGDFHVHTDLSGDGRSPLEVIVEAARARGLRAIAITDHAENLSMNGVKREPLVAQRERVRALQREVGDGIRILHGIELNIGPHGELDYDPEFRDAFDFCLASVHDHFELDRAAQTKRIKTAMLDPKVAMIGHLSARMIGARPGIDLDLDAVFDAAVETNTALEINGGLPRLDISSAAMRRARGRGVTFVLTSDAHQVSELDRIDNARRIALRGWVEPERIANGTTAERMASWLAGDRA
jgi:DNA polymerase (family 10)